MSDIKFIVQDATTEIWFKVQLILISLIWKTCHVFYIRFLNFPLPFKSWPSIYAHEIIQVQKTRFTDEAKYTMNLEQGGIVVDKVVWSVFIKGIYSY